jgi:hypothetical protein
MQTWMRIAEHRVATLAGRVLFRLKLAERSDPYNDTAQCLLFESGETPPQPKSHRRVERLELAVQRLADGYELRVGEYVLDIGFDTSARRVRVASRVLADVYETAVYMGLALTEAGEVDWRPTEMAPEDFYAT